MALERKDSVRDQTTTVGTGTLTVDLVAPAGYRTMAAHTNGRTVRYRIQNATNTEWEVTEGIWTTSGATLTRAATPFASSNAGALVSFSAGAKTITTVSTAKDLDVFQPVRELKVAMAANDIDMSEGGLFTKTISGVQTLTISNAPASGIVGSIIFEVTNAGANITWPAGSKWAGGAAPTLTTTGKDILGMYTHDGGTTLNWVLLGLDEK